jgi:hypothetical protein
MGILKNVREVPMVNGSLMTSKAGTPGGSSEPAEEPS